MPYHERLRNWLRICGMTQARLAAACEVSAQSVYYWVCGDRRPRQEHHDRIVAALGLTDAEFHGSFRRRARASRGAA